MIIHENKMLKKIISGKRIKKLKLFNILISVIKKIIKEKRNV